jgi:tetratricopeptide (TPR) repeat protein
VLTALLLAGSAAAGAPLSAKQKREAEELFKRAEGEYQAGDYETALEGYYAVYQISQSPRILFNIAQCQRLLDRPKEALRLYRQYLFEEPASPIRADVQVLIADLEQKLSTAEQEERSERFRRARRYSSFGLGAVGLGLGASALSLRLRAAQTGELTSSERRRGLTTAVAADLSLVSAAALFYTSRAKVTAAVAPTAGGALLSVGLTLGEAP